MNHYLNMEETLFRNRDAFEIDFIPGIFRFRKAQVNKIRSAIQPGMQGRHQVNLVIRGLPGTGKTTAVHRAFSDIRASNKRLVQVYINCHTELSKFAAFTRIYTELYNQPPPAKGVRVRRLICEIGKALSKREVDLLVCFDDMENLLPENLLDDILGPLLRLCGEYPKTSVKILLLMRDTEAGPGQAPGSRIITALNPEEVYFPPYNEKEIRVILRDRIRAGLNPGVISSKMLSLIIGHTMRGGDIRVGLNLVKRSVMNAEREGRSKVTKEDIMAPFEGSGSAGADRAGSIP